MSQLLKLNLFDDISNNVTVMNELLLDEPNCSNEDDVHYVHLPDSLNKEVFQHKLFVKPDIDFLASEGKSVTNFALLQQEFNPFEASTYERLAGIVSSSIDSEAGFNNESQSKKLFRTDVLSTVKNKKNSINSDCIAYNYLPDADNEWRLEEILIENSLSTRTINENELDEHWKQIPNVDLRDDESNSYLDLVSGVITIYSTNLSMGDVQQEDGELTYIKIDHEKLKNCDQLDASAVSFRESLELVKSDISWPCQDGSESVANWESLQEREIIEDDNKCSTSTCGLFSNSLAQDNTPISDAYEFNNKSECEASEAENQNATGTSAVNSSAQYITLDSDRRENNLTSTNSSFEIPRRFSSPTIDIDYRQISLNFNRNAEINKAHVREEAASVDDKLVCHLSDKDVVNCNNEVVPDNSHLCQINSDSIINSTSFKAKDMEIVATSVDNSVLQRRPQNRNSQECRKYEEENMKKLKHTSNISLKNSAGVDGKVKADNQDVWSVLKTFTELEMKKDTSFILRPKIKDEIKVNVKNDPLQARNKNPNTSDELLSESKTTLKEFINAGSKKLVRKTNFSNQVNSVVQQDDIVCKKQNVNVQLLSNEVQIKAKKVEGNNKLSDNFAFVREHVLAKFNDWVIDIDWNGSDLEELSPDGSLPKTECCEDVSSESNLNVENSAANILTETHGKENPNLISNIVSMESDNNNCSSSQYSSEDFIEKQLFVKSWNFKNTSRNSKRKSSKTNGCQDMFFGLRHLNSSNTSTCTPKLHSPDLALVSQNKKRKKNSEDECLESHEDQFISASKLNSSDLISRKTMTFKETNSISFEVPKELNAGKVENMKMESGNYIHFKIICSSEVAKETELINILETRYNLSFVVRDYVAVATSSQLHAELCNQADFIIDEHSAVLMYPLRSLNDSGQFIKLRKKIYALIIRHSLVWILLVDKSSREPCIHPEVLAVFSKLSVLSIQLNMLVKEFQNKLLICRNTEQAAYYIRRIVDHSIQLSSSSNVTDSNWTSRDWLLMTPSAHELFLSNFPSLSTHHIQIMLGTSSLRNLLQASLEELQQTLPVIPTKCLESFNRLVRRRISSVMHLEDSGLDSEVHQETPSKATSAILPRLSPRKTAPPIVSPVIPSVRNNVIYYNQGQQQHFMSEPSTSYCKNMIPPHTNAMEKSELEQYNNCYNPCLQNNYPAFPGFGCFKSVSSMVESRPHLPTCSGGPTPQHLGPVSNFNPPFYSERPQLGINGWLPMANTQFVLYRHSSSLCTPPTRERFVPPQWYNAFNFSH